jgi:RimJ/RimL family protein N-acetyltransferase
MTMTMRYADPVTLTGRTVRLEPLREGHVPDLFEASRDPEIWQHLPTEWPQTLDQMRDFYRNAFRLQASGERVPFAVIDLATGKAIGTTSYLRLGEANRNVEIGWTWYAKPYQRTSINTECKYLLLKRAFEDLGCIRVQLRTDELNTRSRAAIERIGGVFEGVSRHDRIVKGGRYRSSANYALLVEEWPARKAWFEERLAT